MACCVAANQRHQKIPKLRWTTLKSCDTSELGHEYTGAVDKVIGWKHLACVRRDSGRAPDM